MEEETLKEIENLITELKIERKKSPKNTSKIVKNLYNIGKKYEELGRYN